MDHLSLAERKYVRLLTLYDEVERMQHPPPFVCTVCKDQPPQIETHHHRHIDLSPKPSSSRKRKIHDSSDEEESSSLRERHNNNDNNNNKKKRKKKKKKHSKDRSSLEDDPSGTVDDKQTDQHRRGDDKPITVPKEECRETLHTEAPSKKSVKTEEETTSKKGVSILTEDEDESEGGDSDTCLLKRTKRSRKEHNVTLTVDKALTFIPEKKELEDIFISKQECYSILDLMVKCLKSKPTKAGRFRKSHKLSIKFPKGNDVVAKTVCDVNFECRSNGLHIKTFTALANTNSKPTCVVCTVKIPKGVDRGRLDLTFDESKVDYVIYRDVIHRDKKIDFCSAHNYCLHCYLVYIYTLLPGKTLVCFGTCNSKSGCRQIGAKNTGNDNSTVGNCSSSSSSSEGELEEEEENGGGSESS